MDSIKFNQISIYDILRRLASNLGHNKIKLIITMEYSLKELFPELNNKLSPSIYEVSVSDLENNSYFTQLVELIRNQYGEEDQKNKKMRLQLPFPLKQIEEFKDIRQIISKIAPKAIPVQVPKGTIIYTIGAAPDQGYFLMHGCVELLVKKNNWQRLQSFHGHTLFNVEQRVEFLQNEYRINPKHFQAVEHLFYEDKMTFNFLPFHKLYSGEYFGFKELVRGSLRTKMAIALQDSLLVKVKKHEFDKYLKQFEEKREQHITNCLFSGVRPQIVDDLVHRISFVFNSSELIQLDRDETIFREGELANGIYFLLDGEVLQSKEVRIQVPKKYLNNQNQNQIVKQMMIKLHKLVKNSFVGLIEPIMSIKNREVTCTTCTNSTLLLKLDSGSFLKAASESALYERELNLLAKHKYAVINDAYLKQKSQIVKCYLNQFQALDHRKKEKNLVGLLKNETNFKQNGLYQLFKKEGAFYRDTFQRLEGFEQFQARYDPKRSTINRHKIKSTSQQAQLEHYSKTYKQEMKQTQQRSPTQQADISFEATKKNLMSPSKAANPFQVLGSDYIQKISPISEHNSRSILRKKKKNVTKFQQLQRDEMVFKRVLIKNGRYQVPRQTDKSNIIQAIVNHKFDQVVKKCMSRKNFSLKKALIENRNDLLKEEFKKTLTSMPKQSASLTRIGSSTSVGFTCKGTEEMRKRLQKMKWSTGATMTPGFKERQDPRLQQCIGFNRQPLSSQVKHRSALSSSKMSVNRSPQKIVLLNHMMKPITYTSSQF